MTAPNDVAALVEATSVDPVPDWRWCLSGGQLAALATAEEYRRTGEIKNPAEFADRIDGLVAALQWAGQRRLSAERREREMAAEKDAAASALEAAEDKIATQATATAALQAEVERAKEDREAAERIIGMLMSLCINVGGWISRGLSETATSALREAQADGWAQMGWKSYLASRSASRKENTP